MFAVGLRAQNIFAVVRKIDRDKNISLASQPFDSAAQRFSRRRAVQSVSVEVLQRFGLQVRNDGLVQNFPGGRQILFQQHRRQREHIADVVKAITRIIRGKIVRRLEIHAHEIANGVVVFRAIEPANRDAAGVGMVAVALENLGLDPGGDQLAFLRRRLRFFFRRHLMGLEVLYHLRKSLAVAQHRRFVRVNPQIEVAFFLFPVAAKAVFAEQRFDLGLKSGVAGGLAALGLPGSLGPCCHLGQLKTQGHRTKQDGRAFGH